MKKKMKTKSIQKFQIGIFLALLYNPQNETLRF